MRITKNHILASIKQLTANATPEDALETLVLLWKVDIGLQQHERMSQPEVEQYFKQRRNQRNR